MLQNVNGMLVIKTILFTHQFIYKIHDNLACELSD
jgi:hypothetical protein